MKENRRKKTFETHRAQFPLSAIEMGRMLLRVLKMGEKMIEYFDSFLLFDLWSFLKK